MEGSGHFVIDEKQVKAEECYDGLWVLRTNTVYNAETVAHVYKALWTVEDIIRTAKSILETLAHLPQVQRNHSRPCVLQLPGVATQNRAGTAHEICRLTVRMGTGASRS